MKRLDFILGAFALISVILAVSPAAYAQENGNRDMDGKVIRGPYETNAFGDNWFIGAGGGINVFMIEDYDLAISPSIDANVGKWFTPSIGMRVGYQGFQTKAWADAPSVLGRVKDADKGQYPVKAGYMYYHGDFLWNMSNALSGYKETRFWNLVPYVHTGYFRSYGLGDVDFAENEFALGVGLLHNLRLTDMLDLIIDMRATAVKGDVIASAGPAILGSVTAGLAVDLGWPNFVRTSTIIGSVEMANAEKVALLETAALALEAANDALERENLNLANKNEKLNDQIKRLKQRESTEMDMTAFFEGISPAVYFEIGKTVLAPDELRHLQFIAENLILKAEAGTDIVITVMGTADSNTGTTRRNQFLSEARGKYVCDILINDYGISPDRISIQSDVIKAAGNPALERAGVFTF